ncbi:hypothetical protein KAU08_10840 [bacterium]|nr:hypothetical protein [bacterium]
MAGFCQDSKPEIQEWIFAIGNEGKDIGRILCVSNNNEIYCSGNYTGEMDFDPGPEQATIQHEFSGTGGFLSKYNSTGSYLWATTWDSWDLYNLEMELDQQGNIYVIGEFQGFLEFSDYDPGINLSSDDKRYAFLCKINRNGVIAWVDTWYVTSGYGHKAFGPHDCITISTNNEIYVGGEDKYLRKYSPSGELLSSYDLEFSIIDMCADTEGFVYIVGNYYDSKPLRIRSDGLFTTGIDSGQFIIKLDSDCNQIWARTWIGPGYYPEIAFDNNDNLYISCWSFEELIIDSEYHISKGEFYSYMLKLDTDNNVIWLKDFNTFVIEDMASNLCGEIFISGSTIEDKIVVNETIEFNTGDDDWFVFKFDKDGTISMVISMSLENNDAIRDIESKNCDHVVLTGEVSGDLPDIGVKVLSQRESAIGDDDIFIMQISSEHNSNSLNQSANE